MATKEEYKDTIMRMYDFCIASNHPAHIKEQFTQDLDFLAKLAEEHFEEKAETNYEHFKDEIIEIINSHLALVNGEPRNCSRIDCSYCDFNRHGGCDKKVGEVEEWLKQPYKKPTYKLNQFEYDLIQTYRDCNKYCKLSDRRILQELKDKGYFMDVDYDTKIQDILANCEVIEDRKEVAND